MVQQRIGLVKTIVDNAVIWQHDNQRVIPQICLTESFYEVTDTLVEVIECIEYLIVEMLDGNIPGYMTAKRGIAYQEGLEHRSCQLAECLKSNVITNAPFGCVLFFYCIIFLPSQVLETSGNEITAHIGEVDVATIDIMGFVTSLLLQRTGYIRYRI